MTRANCLEWLELAGKRGYRDGYDEQPQLSRLKVARQFIGPVYGEADAKCLIAAYRMLYSAGEEQRRADVAEEKEVSGEGKAVYKTAKECTCLSVHFCVNEVFSIPCVRKTTAQTAPDAPVERFDDDTKDGTAK